MTEWVILQSILSVAACMAESYRLLASWETEVYVLKRMPPGFYSKPMDCMEQQGQPEFIIVDACKKCI